tara:strand:- start:334 stop:678 length:345 start_codon:yes stop_codon:yes gene_type:complete
MMNVFAHSQPVMSTVAEEVETAKIKTIGHMSFDTNEESMFYNLIFVRDKKYIFALNEQKINEQPGLLKKINQKIKSITDENVRASYSIYTTKYEDDYVFTTHSATIVQNENLFS